jgi:hypothetical protein
VHPQESGGDRGPLQVVSGDPVPAEHSLNVTQKGLGSGVWRQGPFPHPDLMARLVGQGWMWRD